MTGIVADAVWKRRWAAEQLGLDPNAASAQARVALLRRLAESDFNPPYLWPQALAILEDRRAPAAEEAALRDEAERLRNELESFAQNYWKFDVEERRRRWNDLSKACAIAPALLARLKSLECGLDIGPAKAGEPKVDELVRSVQQLFILRPAERAAMRRELLRDLEQDRTAWQAAADVGMRCPALAALEPRLLSELVRGAQRQRQIAGVQKALFRPRRRVPEFAPARSGKNLLRFPFWIVSLIFIGLGVFRGVMDDKPSSSRPAPNSQPWYQTPHLDPNLLHPWGQQKSRLPTSQPKNGSDSGHVVDPLGPAFRSQLEKQLGIEVEIHRAAEGGSRGDSFRPGPAVPIKPPNGREIQPGRSSASSSAGSGGP